MTTPTTTDDLERLFATETDDVVRSCALDACRLALGIWEKHAGGIALSYHDGVIGMHHTIDPSLPRRTWEAVQSSSSLHALDQEWMEPLTALQDDDWDIPGVSCAAFYAVSGMWFPFNPAGWDYAVHFVSWTFAFLPGFAALLWRWR